MDQHYVMIFNLFIKYIKRFPTKYELETHKKRFIEIHKLSLESINKEFAGCLEAKQNKDNLPPKYDDIENAIEYINSKKTFYDNIINSKSEIYNDVLIRHHHNIVNGQISFNPIICVNNEKIIRSSNSYLLEHELNRYYRGNYEKNYKIYKNINENYIQIISSNEIDYEIKDECIYFGNAFLDSNIGHTSSIIFNFLERYKTIINPNIKIVVTDNTYPNIIKLLLIFVNENQIIKLEQKKIYKFKNITIKHLNIHDIISIERNKITISKIISSNQVQSYKKLGLENKKVLMVKTKGIHHSKCKVFTLTNDIINFLNDNNVIIIKPEEICIYKLIYILANAETIVTSEGAISYNHMIYFNKKANLYFIGSRYLYSNTLPFKYTNHFDINELRRIY
jgi:hypothetical protein